MDRLTKNTWVEGWLPAGTLVRNVRELHDEYEYTVITHFEASLDNGATWYQLRTYDRLKVKQ